MDQIIYDSVIRLIKQLVDHYNTNIANRFTRPVLVQLPFDPVLWDQIKAITERYDQPGYKGHRIDDLYQQILALTKFVEVVRREVAPSLRYKIVGNYPDKMDRVVREMTINNFSDNLQIFANLIYELYTKLVELDTEASKGKIPVYKQYAELDDIKEKLLKYNEPVQ